MGKWTEKVEELVHPGRIKVPYTWSVGEVGSRFFVELRDHKKIFGTRCPLCKKVIVPARKLCGQCFRQTDDWVEVGDQGTIQALTVVRYPSAVQPLKPPFGYGIITLDGADTGMTHLLYGSDPATWAVGMRARAVFKEERAGNILDIAYFQPLAGCGKTPNHRHSRESGSPDAVPTKVGNHLKDQIPVFTGNPGFLLPQE